MKRVIITQKVIQIHLESERRFLVILYILLNSFFEYAIGRRSLANHKTWAACTQLSQRKNDKNPA
jgi:hypothetical protein